MLLLESKNKTCHLQRLLQILWGTLFLPPLISVPKISIRFSNLTKVYLSF